MLASWSESLDRSILQWIVTVPPQQPILYLVSAMLPGSGRTLMEPGEVEQFT